MPAVLRKLRNALARRETSPLPLAVFRIVYGLVLLAEVCQLFYFRHLIFDEIPYLRPAEAAQTYALAAWIVVLGCLILGLHTRTACVINYILSLVVLSTLRNFEYHCDHIYLGVNLLLIFAPVGEVLSLDRRRAVRANPGAAVERATVSGLYADALVFVAIGLVYFDSFFWKCDQSIWRNGLGVGLPMSLPQNIWLPPTIVNLIANQKTLLAFLSYLTLVFEATFLFAMWYRPLRPWLVVIGVGLHFGILVAFPIPFFGLTMLALYLLVAPPEWFDRAEEWLVQRWGRTRGKASMGAPQFGRVAIRRRNLRTDPVAEPGTRPVGRQPNAPLPHRFGVRAAGFHAPGTPVPAGIAVRQASERRSYAISAMRANASLSAAFRAFVESELEDELLADREATLKRGPGTPSSSVLDSTINGNPNSANCDRNLWITAALCFVAAVMQFLLILETPVLGIKDYSSIAPPTRAEAAYAGLKEMLYDLAGISSHGVFLDGHFKDYNRIIAVTFLRPDGSQKWLPILSERGTAKRYASGRIWCNWLFRSTSKYCDLATLERGVQRYTAFWAAQNNISLTNATFYVQVKRLDTIGDWEQDFLWRQTQKPWQFAGHGTWLNNQFRLNVDAELLK